MTTNTATFLFTPPQREAIAELARAYASFHFDSGRTTLVKDAAQRLLAAQDAVGVELVKRDVLADFIQREAA